jgi:hypothetical protein
MFNAAQEIERMGMLLEAGGGRYWEARCLELESDIGSLKAAFRVNMLRANASHEEIDAVISAALGEKKDG